MSPAELSAPFATRTTPLTSAIQDDTRCAECAITLAELPFSSVCGRSMTFTATIAAVPPASGTPSGTVAFTADGAPATCATLHDGVATFTVTLSAGTHTITASYLGDACFNGTPPVSLTTWNRGTGFSDPADLIPEPRSTAGEQSSPSAVSPRLRC